MTAQYSFFIQSLDLEDHFASLTFQKTLKLDIIDIVQDVELHVLLTDL